MCSSLIELGRRTVLMEREKLDYQLQFPFLLKLWPTTSPCALHYLKPGDYLCSARSYRLEHWRFQVLAEPGEHLLPTLHRRQRHLQEHRSPHAA